MSTKIEQLIDEIEEFIDGCKFKALSNTQIIVDKEHMYELLRELRMKTPEEIKHYQKIINNRDAILNDAREKANNLISEATMHTSKLVNENEIMQQAHAQANEIITMASNRAQEILDNATIEANTMRDAILQYTDEMLANVESIIATAMEGASFKYEELMSGLGSCYETVKSNRAQLYPVAEMEAVDAHKSAASVNLDLI